MSIFTREPSSTIQVFAKPGKQIRSVKIVSFLKKKHPATDSFGFQWERYAKVQIDRFNHTTITEDHLRRLLGFPLQKLKPMTVLEIGSGAGRYTDILRRYAKMVITVDSSSAIKHNVALGFSNVKPIQADLFDLPINPKEIDIVYCRGVLQHTKDPVTALQQLFSYVKAGGLVAFDIYPKTWKTIFFTKYYLRPFTKTLDKKKFAYFLEKNIPRILRFKSKWINPLFPDIRFIRDIPNILIPIADYTQYKPLSGFTFEEYVQWCILDTFDMYTPEYDSPMSFEEVLNSLPEHTKVVRADRDQFHYVIERTV